MSAHAKRRTRTRRRFAAILTVYSAGLTEMGQLFPVLVPAKFRGKASPPEYALLPPEQVQAELELAAIGRRRAKGRPPKPINSNDAVIALLRKDRAADFTGRFTLSRAEATRKWLQRRGIHKAADAITKMVNRAKRRK